MKRLHAVTLGFVAVAAVALLAVWQAPQWLDWTRYRATIEAAASSTLGQPVSISGPISLTLLPQPVLTASQVSVGADGTASPSMHVEALRLRIALWPLIAGRVDARELVLRGPDLRIPWPARSGVLHSRPPTWLAAFAARIENGRLTVGQAAFSGIDADIRTLDTGALSASGAARFGGQEWHFTARLTAVGADGAAGLDMTLDGRGKANGLGASFSGQLALDGTLAGTVTSRGPDLSVLLPAPAVPFRADGRLAIGNGVAAVDELGLEIGGSPASGTVTLRITPSRRLDLTLAASRLDLDAWLSVLPRAQTTDGFDGPIALDVSAEAASLGGGTLEHVHGVLELIGRDVVARQVTARLPGNAGLQLHGRMVREDPAQARFEGDARLDAPELRTTLHWLDHALPGLLPERLMAALPDGTAQRAGLSAHVVAGQGEVSLRQLAGSLDGIPVSGLLVLKRGEPPVLTADLSLDRLALDPWMPPQPADLVGLSRGMSGVDAELRLNVRRASIAGTAVDGLAIDAAVEAGNVRLRRAEGTSRGAHFVASGIIGDGGKLSEGRLSVETGDATALAGLLPLSWRATPALWQGPARLSVEARGPQEALSADVNLALADARLEASPTINLHSGEWSAAIAVRHPGARRLIAALGLPKQEGLYALPEWLGDGSLSLLAQLAGRPGRLDVKIFDLTAATLHARGGLTFDLGHGEPSVSGRVDTDAVTLPVPSGASRVPLPLNVLRGWRGDVQLAAGRLAAETGPVVTDATARFSLADGRLRIEDFTAKLGSGAVAGSLAFSADTSPPALEVQARVTDAAITGPFGDGPIDLLSGRADAILRVSSVGYSPSAMLATLNGSFSLKLHDGATSGFDLFGLKQAIEKPDPKSAQTAAEDALQSGTTGFDRLEIAGSIAHGDLVIESASMTGAAGEARASGRINLAADTIDARIAMEPTLPDPPQVTLRLTGPIDRPNRMTELSDLARWMAALVH